MIDQQTLMNKSSSDIWVGAFIKTGALILHDPNLQIGGREWVNLYSVDHNEIRPFDRSIVREKVRRANHTEYDYALRAYETWTQKDNGSFVADELLAKKRKEEQHSSDLTPKDQRDKINKHREFLRKTGKSGEEKIVNARWDRATHCYSCKSSITMPNLECTSCNWIICECGACGCGY